FGGFILFFSPAREILPGYLKEDQRYATQEQLLRLDSLQIAFNNNSLFLENFRNVLDPAPIVRDSLSVSLQISSDSLLPTSPEEKKFVAVITERNKYNISVLAPLAAESMMFSPVNEEAIFAENSKNSNKAEIILSKGAPVSSIADGKVISVSQSVREGGGSAVIIQHSKGFLSRFSRLGTLLVEPGDDVAGGQVIAVPATGNARKNEIIYIEMWHNGTPLIPYEYLGDSGFPQSYLQE
ncbi:MAG: M23 family metallopeptidase, partial [Muribaculaceae bacterium]|nr:M23 family metallopeptidase [Muribaculaceae bacterium]